MDAPVPKHLVYDKLFVYDDTYPKVNRPPLQVFTREMGIACAKRLMSKYTEEPSLGTCDQWEFNPIRYEVLVRSHNNIYDNMDYNFIITKILFVAYFA